MQRTWLYRTQHTALKLLASKLDEQIVSNMPPASIRLALAAFAEQLEVHLKVEDDVLYPRLLGDADAAVSELAYRYRVEMGGLAAAFRTFAAAWSAEAAIDQDPIGFAEQWMRMRTAIDRRIDAEDSELYPLVDGLSRPDESVDATTAVERTV